MQSYIRRAPDSTLGVLYPINKMPRSFLQSLGCAVPSRLEVEGTLVLQPPPVSSNATNLLAVVIRWRVGQRGRGRIDAVALDAVEEGGIFPCEFAKYTPVSQIEDLVTKNGPNKPSHGHHTQGAQSHEHEGVKTTELGGKGGIVAIVDHGGETKVCHAYCADSRASLADSPARAA